jgi:hypothetical protein
MHYFLVTSESMYAKICAELVVLITYVTCVISGVLFSYYSWYLIVLEVLLHSLDP